MFKSSHCLRTESLSFFRMKLGDGTSHSAKAVLKKVTLQCQLTDRLQHLVILLLQGCLLSLCFFASLDPSTKTPLTFSRNSFFQFRTMLGFRLFSAAISPNSRSPWFAAFYCIFSQESALRHREILKLRLAETNPHKNDIIWKMLIRVNT